MSVKIYCGFCGKQTEEGKGDCVYNSRIDSHLCMMCFTNFSLNYLPVEPVTIIKTNGDDKTIKKSEKEL